MTLSEALHPTNSLHKRVFNYISNWSTRRFLITIIVIQILAHIPIVSLPPMGQHTWRQVVWTAAARNYFEEGNSFFFPSQDTRIAPGEKGLIYFELPLLPYITGMSYHLTGFSHANMRIVMLLMGIFLIYGSYQFMRGFGASESRARWFTFFVSFSPYFFYYSITACPNLPALTWFVWGIALITPQLEEQNWNWKFWLGIVFITIGTLSKATYLFFGLPVAYLFLKEIHKSRNIKLLAITMLSFLLVLVPNILMYSHSLSLYNEAPLEQQRAMILSPGYSPGSWKDLTSTLRPAILEWFLQMYVNTMAISFFMIGFFKAIKNHKWNNKFGMFWIFWLLSFLIYSTFFFTQFREHAYYLTPLLIFAAMGSTYGIEIWLRSGRLKSLLYVLLICIPIVMVGRVGHRWLWAKQVPEELLHNTGEIQQYLPKDKRVIVFGDSSPIVYLYYLQRKGVVASPNVALTQFKEYYDFGFRYIVSDVPIPDIPSLKEYQLEIVSKIGNFTVARIID